MSHSQASEASLNILMKFLSNTAPDKVEAAADRLVAPDATYVSLNFSNPELKKIMPWTGTDKGHRAYSGTFLGVANYWKIEGFTVTDKFASAPLDSWQTLSIPLACLTDQGADLSHVTAPFAVTTGGQFAVSFAEVGISRAPAKRHCH